MKEMEMMIREAAEDFNGHEFANIMYDFENGDIWCDRYLTANEEIVYEQPNTVISLIGKGYDTVTEKRIKQAIENFKSYHEQYDPDMYDMVEWSHLHL